MSLLDKFRKHGLRGIFDFVLHKVLHIQIGRIHYLRLDTDIQRVEEALADFDLEVKRLSYEDFLTGNQTEFNEKKLQLIKARIEDPNYIAYGIVEEGKLIYSTWISLHRLGLPVQPSSPIYMAENEGLLEDSYCAPQARGRGLHAKMNFYRIKKLYEMGKTRVLALVLEGNTPAFKVQYKSGFKHLGSFRCGYLFGRPYLTLDKTYFDRIA